MTIEDRREREKRELHELILKTAAEMFRKHGYEKTSMRAIAQAIDYSPGTIYRYFKDKDELMFAISVNGFRIFYQYLSVVRHIDNPMERLQVLGRQYIRFAIDHPAYYDLMFIMPDPIKGIGEGEHWEDGHRSHTVLVDVIKECMQEGHFKGHDPIDLSLMIWGQVHGILALYLRHRMEMYTDKKHEVLLNDALEAFNSIIRNS
ncbi:MAG: TetR family transcriptional regulator [Bacteroidetes bacterium HLUCCA01]|nr:MAG: TetR family transcriptional regulator [Bacteroidetes bacterium HLUCCA01]